MLTLPIKKRWFDMILSGEKKEEYREVKPYYERRFNSLFLFVGSNEYREQICFRNGYSAKSNSFIAECSLHKGNGKIEWGAEQDIEYFILTIHKVLKR